MEGSASSPRRANAARVSSGCSRIHLRSNMDVTLLLAPATAPAAGGPPGTKKKPPDFRGGLDRGATLILPDAPRRRMARADCIGPNRLASPPRASDGGGWPPAPGWIPLPARPAHSTRRLSGRAGRRVLVPIIASAFSLGFHYIRTWSGPARPAPAGAGSPWTAAA